MSQIQINELGMRKEFGLWWTPKEIVDLKEMGILGLDMQGWQVQCALSGFEQARERAFMKGAAIGWVGALALMLVLRWLTP